MAVHLCLCQHIVSVLTDLFIDFTFMTEANIHRGHV